MFWKLQTAVDPHPHLSEWSLSLGIMCVHFILSTIPWPLSAPFLFHTSGKGNDWATPLEMEKNGRIDFHSVTSQILSKIPKNWWVHMLRTTRNWSKIFYVHFPGRRNHFSKGDLLKNAKGPRLTWMSACWLVEVFARPITAEDTSELISDLENKLHFDWSVWS